jgi:hypothetical protein
VPKRAVTAPRYCPDDATLPEYESMLRDALDAMGAAPRAELLHTLELADFRRAEHISELWSSPKTRSIADR